MIRLIFLLILVASCSQQEIELEPVRPVLTEVVQLVSGVEKVNFSGFSKAVLSINVSFRVRGRIDFYPIKVGDQLKRGQLIAQLDPRDYQLEFEKAQAALEKGQAEERNAASNYKRIKLLYESESASRNELDSSRAAYEGARAGVVRSVAAVDLAETQLSYTKLFTTHSNCTVAEVFTEVGENVRMAQNIATITCGDQLEVEVAVPENYIASIVQGMEADIVFNAVSERYFPGTVTKVGNVASGGTTFPVTVQLNKIEKDLRSGMAARVILSPKVEEDFKIIMIPGEAVTEDSEGRFVYVFEEDNDDEGTARRRSVTVEGMRLGRIQISSGLEAGERVITAGLRYLEDGRKVKLSDYKKKERD